MQIAPHGSKWALKACLAAVVCLVAAFCFAAPSAFAAQQDPIDVYGTAHPGSSGTSEGSGADLGSIRSNSAQTYSASDEPVWKGSYGANKFKLGSTTYTVRGSLGMCIDVSGHQGYLDVNDWKAIKADGVKYAIIRCGYGDDYSNQDDSRWITNVRNARAAGVQVGVYLYSYAIRTTGEESAASEAAHVLRCLRAAGLKPADLALPVYYDLEDAYQSDLKRSQYYSLADRFCSTLEAAGYKTGIYANTHWWQSKLNDSRITAKMSSGQWSRWVAQYYNRCDIGNDPNSGTTVNPNGRYGSNLDIWQFSSKSKVSNVSGYVDMNFIMSMPDRATSKKSITKFTVGSTSLAYTGSTRVPSINAYSGSTKLIRNTDFTVSGGAKKVGTHKVTAKGTGSYTGSKSYTYTIKPATPKVTKIKNRSHGFRVYWSATKAQTSGYKIYYSTSKGFKNYKTYKVTNEDLRAQTVRGMPKYKTYYAKVRAYKVVNGKTYYSSYSNVVKVKTR